MAEAYIRDIRESLEQMNIGITNNDTSRLPLLPFFGNNEQEGSNLWVLKDMGEFLKHIDDATAGPRFNDAGRIKVCQSKLMGIPKSIFRSFTGETWQEAQTYLMEHYPSANTYQKVCMNLHSIKRMRGERIIELASRIERAFDKVERIAPALSAGRNIQTKEILLSLLPVSIRLHLM